MNESIHNMAMTMEVSFGDEESDGLIHDKVFSESENTQLVNSSLRRRQLQQQECTIGGVMLLLIVTGIFYGTGAISVISLQKMVQSYPFPFLWCSVQFFISYVLSALFVRGRGLHKNSSKVSPWLGSTIAICYTLGFAFTNISLEYVAAPFLETVRSMECITTTILGMVYLKEKSSYRCLLTLGVVCGGVILSCRETATFSIIGCIWLTLSNLAFSGRSVVSRVLQKTHPRDIHPIKLFSDSSLYGLVLLLPFVVLLESKDIYNCLMLRVRCSKYYKGFGDEAMEMTDYFSGQPLSLMIIVVINGVSFSISSALSFVLLYRTDLLTHSVMTVFRRLFCIFISSTYFGITLTQANISGIAVSTAGVIMYSYFKLADRANSLT